MFCSDEWNAVQPGSMLHVEFTCDDSAAITGTYRVQSDHAADETEIDGASFPLRRRVSHGERHEVTFRAMFTGSRSDVSLVATVVRPDQSLHGQPYQCSGTLDDQDPLCTVELFANGAV
ncbi:MAG TPA: hypothetical protein VFQ45_09260 [Longimicrobium sp.]|nr:hypothetical protein [Longimicrobium sp.]